MKERIPEGISQKTTREVRKGKEEGMREVCISIQQKEKESR